MLYCQPPHLLPSISMIYVEIAHNMSGEPSFDRKQDWIQLPLDYIYTLDNYHLFDDDM